MSVTWTVPDAFLRWEVMVVPDHQLDQPLYDYWEPFSASYDHVTRTHYIYLRRKTYKAER